MAQDFGSGLERRAFLQGLALSPFVLSGVGVFSGAVRAQAAAAGLVAPNVCMLSPEVTEGPFYLDEGLVRSDITEGRAGVPMRLTLQVVRADCTPIEGARVDLWHCDAEGNYSGVGDQQGATYLRGIQMSDAQGTVTFETIYPGWYRGRTTHMHYKIWLGDRQVLTSQIFFPDALSEYLFRSVAPYNGRREDRDTMNGADSIAEQAGAGAFAMIREQTARYDAALVVGVDETALSADSGRGGDQ